jgi:hypothetical protein
VLSPLFNDDFYFRSIAEPFKVQALIPELAVEALINAILPRLARINERYINVL